MSRALLKAAVVATAATIASHAAAGPKQKASLSSPAPMMITAEASCIGDVTTNFKGPDFRGWVSIFVNRNDLKQRGHVHVVTTKLANDEELTRETGIYAFDTKLTLRQELDGSIETKKDEFPARSREQQSQVEAVARQLLELTRKMADRLPGEEVCKAIAAGSSKQTPETEFALDIKKYPETADAGDKFRLIPSILRAKTGVKLSAHP